jgi:hypothetical protein
LIIQTPHPAGGEYVAPHKITRSHAPMSSVALTFGAT